MSVEFNTVLVAGATGDMGYRVALALLEKKKSTIKILVRPSAHTDPAKKAKIDALAKKGAVVVEADTDSLPALTAAFKGVDAVVSAVAGNDLQKADLLFIEASKAAGVKRVVPSGFGLTISAITDHSNLLYAFKAPVEAAAKASGVDYTFFGNGLFYDLLSVYAFDHKNRTVLVPGNESINVSLTDREDAAKLLAEALYDPRSRNAVVEVAGVTQPWADTIATVEKAYGHKYTRIQKSEAELKEQLKTEKNFFAGFMLHLQALHAVGQAANKTVNRSWYPHIKTRPLSAFLPSIEG